MNFFQLKSVYFFALFVLGVRGLVGEEIHPLPPITISLNAPIQIDDTNREEQEKVLKTTAERVQAALRQKRFPIEGLLLILGLVFLRFVLKRQKPQIVIEPQPSLTPTERIERAAIILSHAGEALSEKESLAIFHLLDPVAQTLPEPGKYRELADRAKFAGYTVKKSEFIKIN